MEEWDRILNIDLRGVFLCMKFEIPYSMLSTCSIVRARPPASRSTTMPPLRSNLKTSSIPESGGVLPTVPVNSSLASPSSFTRPRSATASGSTQRLMMRAAVPFWYGLVARVRQS